jgi:hypothetical protein
MTTFWILERCNILIMSISTTKNLLEVKGDCCGIKKILQCNKLIYKEMRMKD